MQTNIAMYLLQMKQKRSDYESKDFVSWTNKNVCRTNSGDELTEPINTIEYNLM